MNKQQFNIIFNELGIAEKFREPSEKVLIGGMAIRTAERFCFGKMTNTVGPKVKQILRCFDMCQRVLNAGSVELAISSKKISSMDGLAKALDQAKASEVVK